KPRMLLPNTSRPDRNTVSTASRMSSRSFSYSVRYPHTRIVIASPLRGPSCSPEAVYAGEQAACLDVQVVPVPHQLHPLPHGQPAEVVRYVGGEVLAHVDHPVPGLRVVEAPALF